MRKYIEVTDEMSICLNFRSTNEQKAKDNKQVFNSCLCELKDDFKQDVSTKFLRGLVIGDDKQKSNRVTYLLREIGLKNRVKVTDSYFYECPKMHEKDIEVSLYKSRKEGNEEKISLRVVGMTSHGKDGIKRPCKVGVITSRAVRQVSLSQVVI